MKRQVARPKRLPQREDSSDSDWEQKEEAEQVRKDKKLAQQLAREEQRAKDKQEEEDLRVAKRLAASVQEEEEENDDDEGDDAVAVVVAESLQPLQPLHQEVLVQKMAEDEKEEAKKELTLPLTFKWREGLIFTVMGFLESDSTFVCVISEPEAFSSVKNLIRLLDTKGLPRSSVMKISVVGNRGGNFFSHFHVKHTGSKTFGEILDSGYKIINRCQIADLIHISSYWVLSPGLVPGGLVEPEVAPEVSSSVALPAAPAAPLAPSAAPSSFFKVQMDETMAKKAAIMAQLKAASEKREALRRELTDIGNSVTTLGRECDATDAKIKFIDRAEQRMLSTVTSAVTSIIEEMKKF